jgi:hypothetical protein
VDPCVTVISSSERRKGIGRVYGPNNKKDGREGDCTMEAIIVFGFVGVLMVVLAVGGRIPPGASMDPRSPEAC